MHIHIPITALIVSYAICASVPATAAADPTIEVKFLVPLNLTRLQADITAIQLTCFVYSEVFRDGDGKNNHIDVVVPVSKGSVVKNVEVAFQWGKSTITSAASGHPASYTCHIEGRTSTGQTYFGRVVPGGGMLRLTPLPQDISGEFVW